MQKSTVSKYALYLFIVHMCCLIINGTSYFNIGDRSVLYLLIILISFFGRMFVNKGKAIQPFFTNERRIAMVMVFFTFYSIFFVNTNYQTGTFLASEVFFLLIYSWTFNDFDEIQIKQLKNAYIFSALILAIGIMVSRYQPYSGSMASRMPIMSYTGAFYDVNFLTSYIAIPTILVLNDFITKKESKLFNFVLLIVLTLSILLGGSRTALAVIFIALLLLFWNHKRLSGSTLFIIMVIFLAANIAIRFLPQDMMQHYLRGIVVTDDSRRMNDWSYGISLISQAPLFGSGMVSTRSLIIMYYQKTWITVHNTYLAIFVNYGLIFGSLIIMMMAIPLYRMFKFKAPIEYQISYIMYLVSILVIEANFSDIMIIPICIYFAIANYYKYQYNRVSQLE